MQAGQKYQFRFKGKKCNPPPIGSIKGKKQHSQVSHFFIKENLMKQAVTRDFVFYACSVKVSNMLKIIRLLLNPSADANYPD